MGYVIAALEDKPSFTTMDSGWESSSELDLFRTLAEETASRVSEVEIQELHENGETTVYILTDACRSWLSADKNGIITCWGLIDLRTTPPVIKGAQGAPHSLSILTNVFG